MQPQKKHLGRKGIRMEIYKRDCNAHRYVLPSAGESSRGFLTTKYKWQFNESLLGVYNILPQLKAGESRGGSLSTRYT